MKEKEKGYKESKRARVEIEKDDWIQLRKKDRKERKERTNF